MLHVTDIEQSIQEIQNVILVGLKMPFKDWDNEMSMRLILKVFIYFLACKNMFFSKHKELSPQNKAVFMKHGIDFFFDLTVNTHGPRHSKMSSDKKVFHISIEFESEPTSNCKIKSMDQNVYFGEWSILGAFNLFENAHFLTFMRLFHIYAFEINISITFIYVYTVNSL